MTTALLSNYDLPLVIKEKIPQEWRKCLASDYLDVNMLFGSGVIVTLENSLLKEEERTSQLNYLDWHPIKHF